MNVFESLLEANLPEGHSQARFLPAGERGLVVELGNLISPGVNARVHRLAKLLSERDLEGVIEVVPTYRSLLVYFDPLRLERSRLVAVIADMLGSDTLPAADPKRKVRVVHVPVCYGGEFGPDLDDVARHNGLSPEQVIAIHSSRPYLVYMLGFTPGFPYLGGMSRKIATPRLENPRPKIPRGSVGIAGAQTGIYPVESPGGWRLIGRTPLNCFDPRSPDPFLFSAGDHLRFIPITPDRYHDLRRRVESGFLEPEIRIATLEEVPGD